MALIGFGSIYQRGGVEVAVVVLDELADSPFDLWLTDCGCGFTARHNLDPLYGSRGERTAPPQVYGSRPIPHAGLPGAVFMTIAQWVQQLRKPAIGIKTEVYRKCQDRFRLTALAA